MAKKEIGENGLRIVSLQAENVKKLTAVEITPSGDIVTVAGPNGAGKSSVLDSIWWALSGTRHIQAQPIRKGETKAFIRLDLGELVIERRFSEHGSQLVVDSAEGARFTSPQKLLDALLGELTFDPLAFTRMDPKEQVDELRRVAQLDVDIDKLDGQNASDYDRRTEVNRQAKAARAQAQAIVIAQGLPDQPLDESAMIDEIQRAGEHNAQIEQRKSRRADTERDIKERRDAAVRLKTRAADLRADADRLDADAAAESERADKLEQKLKDAPALPDAVDVATIRARLEHAKQVNLKLAARRRRRELDQQAAELEAKAAQFTEQIEARQRAKSEAIAQAKMPVPGLGFADGVVTFNEIPFDQASSAEQLKVSFGIARAANPKLRVILIKDGSLLDENSLAQIAEMAREGGYQVWIEKVSTDRRVGVFIEDGAVVAVDGRPVETETA